MAHEELRVADEELRAQREQIEELLRRSADEQAWRGRVGNMLPVPHAVTDGRGRILEANAAAALLVQVSLTRLIGKPLPAYVADEDRRALRATISQLAGGTAEGRLSLRLLLPGQEPIRVGVVGSSTRRCPAGAP